jgi:SHS2 domain-containing protein
VKGYEELDPNADVAIRAYGDGVETLFANAATGMFSLIVELDTVEAKGEVRVEVSGEDLKSALVAFLSELLFVHETQNIILKEFDVTVEGFHVTAVARGETVDRERHTLLLNVKAVTYHNMELDPAAGRATVVFDI